MQNNALHNTLVIITGPTAVGKTSLCIDIAKHFNTAIISCDSRQFYREMKIGTASPTEEELNAVQHYFIGNLSIQDNYNAYRFEQDTLKLLEERFKENNIVIMTGGSGLYIDALCYGVDEMPDPDEKMREELNKIYNLEGIKGLQNKLREIDPDGLETIDHKNPKRIMRGIEVCMTTGKKLSEIRKGTKAKRNFDIIKIGLYRDRQELYERINKRVDEMIKQGLIEEAKKLFPNRAFNALNTVGYKELFKHLNGEYTLEWAIEKIKTNSRRYAKRQLTWFRKYNDLHWFHPSEKSKIIDLIEKKLQ